jgi:uncharacterized membrane protein
MKTIQKNYEPNAVLSYAYFLICILLFIGFYLLMSGNFTQFVSSVSTDAGSISESSF